MALAGVIEQPDIGQDDRIDAEIGGAIDGPEPVRLAPGLRKGVDRHQHMLAARMGVTDTLDHGFLIEIQAGEIARVGVVLVAEIDGIGAVIDRRLERRETAGGADEFG